MPSAVWYFNPRAPCGARLPRIQQILPSIVFQSTCPLRGTTFCSSTTGRMLENFNPRAPCGARRSTHSSRLWWASYFNPRAPCGARQVTPLRRCGSEGFQSTCPLRGTTTSARGRRRGDGISIHVPLAGHDPNRIAVHNIAAISIHVPLAGHDKAGQSLPFLRKEFQSTCPLRGTTTPSALAA